MTKESTTSVPEENGAGVSAGAPQDIQSDPDSTPAGWLEVQEKIAESLNLSVLLVNGHQPPALALSNNNSICQAFQSSPDFVSLCDPYCGEAHKRAMSAGSTVNYTCHAGLQCFTMPVQIGRKKDLAAIGGRAFVSVADYRSLVDRFRAGELNELLTREPFSNVIFAESQKLEQLSERLERATRKFAEPMQGPPNLEIPIEELAVAGQDEVAVEGPIEAETISEQEKLEVQSSVEIASDSPQVEASVESPVETAITNEVVELNIQSPVETSIVTPDDVAVESPLEADSVTVQAEVDVHDAILQSPDPDESATDNDQIAVESQASNDGEVTGPNVTEQVAEMLEPVLAESDSTADLQIEIDRLRSELEYRTNLAHSLQSFLERISSNDPDKTYKLILTHSKELLKAERASLWVFDEGSNEIILRAAVGFTDAHNEVGRIRLGEGISGSVLESGQALIVENFMVAGLTPAPPERNYKTSSFISYPISMSGRKIGVLNVTDKVGGLNFDTVDLSLLDVIGPQIAVALERAEWQERATQFQLMSITDPLTGLLNRRYLEERLTEELNRSKRYSYPMSCLMIDIDDFKSYNDRNGHQAGDVALKITAHSLKAALRSADIACRYGGEEFCILLPQTSLSEAGVIAERMRLKVSETDFPYGKAQPRGLVSISVGVSTFGKHIDTAESVIAAADRALYNAKRLGKNRIEFYVDNLSSTATR